MNKYFISICGKFLYRTGGGKTDYFNNGEYCPAWVQSAAYARGGYLYQKENNSKRLSRNEARKMFPAAFKVK